MEIFSARSAIAHGGASSAVESADFVRGVARDVVWATYRLLAFEDRFSPHNDEDVDDGFERLRWGTASWP
jgi:hypothetical protein